MKRFRKVQLCLSFISLSMSLVGQPSHRTYVNAVIPGDHSDCTLTKVGNDFYTTGSSFNPTPVIYHSTDLVHWEAIAQPVSAAWPEYGDKDHAGCWGGQMVYYNQKYWDFFSLGGGMCFVTADKPEGPWSMPTRIANPKELPYTLGYDNSIFIDDDGKWYMVVKNGKPNNGIVELGADGQPTGLVYNLSWLNPECKNFPFSWAEGPVMWKQNGYYYYSCAHDVSGGQKVIRSRSLTADSAAWTTPVDLFDEKNPGKMEAIFSGPNHSSAAVALNDGTHWILHPVWARGNQGEWLGQGRQGLLNQIRYAADGSVVADYPTNISFTAPALPSSGIPWMVPKSDFFDSETLHPEWSFLGYTAANTHSLTERRGWLRMRPKSSNRLNTVIKTDAEHAYTLMTRVDFKPKDVNDEAGLRIMNGDELLFVKLCLSKDARSQEVIRFSFEKTSYSVEHLTGAVVWLKLQRDQHSISAYYSMDGDQWLPVGKSIDVAKLDRYSANYNGWCGNRQGLYVQGSTMADFDLYIYRDAYSVIPANCPANWYGTSPGRTSGGENVLENIHSDDWAMYAGVEFRSENEWKPCSQVQITGMPTTSNAVIEVWADSLDSGYKIATFNVKAADKRSNKAETYVVKSNKISGRHDVYLKFKGQDSKELFKLQSLQFLR